MAASMLSVLHCSRRFMTRHSCSICGRGFSTEAQETQSTQDNSLHKVQATKQEQFHQRYVEAQRLKRRKRPRSNNIWSKAFSKLNIKETNLEVPTINHRGVELPRKVKRDPLTVLKALSETVQVENAGVNYNMVDDPRLLANMKKENLIQAKLDGKRTAREMMAMYKKAFVAYQAHPEIPDFQPLSEGYADTSLSVNALEERINKRRVNHAIEIYERLGEKGEEVPIEVEERLLELLCVFNGADQVEPELVLMPIFPKSAETVQESQDWKCELAELIFDKHVEAGTVTPHMYNMYVCGLLKHSHFNFRDKETETIPAVKKALELYKKMMKESIPVFLCTFNHVISRNSSIISIEEVLRDMKSVGLVPTKETFSQAMIGARAKDVYKIFAEKRLAGIDYNFRDMVNIFYLYPRKPEFLEEIVDFMAQQKTWYLDHSKENIFDAMMRYFVRKPSEENVPVARKLYKLQKDLGTRFRLEKVNKDKFFYCNYFFLMLDYGTFDEMAEVYQEVIPHFMLITDKMLERILRKMDRESAPGDMLIDLYHDSFNFVGRRPEHFSRIMQRMNLVFRAMLQERHNSELRKQFAEISYKFYKEFIIEEMELQRTQDIIRTILPSNAIKSCLEVMLSEPSYLEKAWECYMAYADKSMELFRKQDLKWKPIIEKLIEAQEVLKIRQFLNKINMSSSWAKHDFLKDMKEPLEEILGEEERETLYHILSNLKK